MENLEKLFDPRIIEKVKTLRLMDDDLMTKVFSDDLEATEFMLRILMKNDSLKVLESHGQEELRNIFGRTIRLDILAEDANHNLINVEIQRACNGASPKRARFHASMLDSHFLEKNKDFEELKSTYIIFITENDLWSKGLPIYRINKTIEGTDMPFEDDLHILYVNGEYRGKDSLGDLMHDFSCQNPDDMKYKELARKVRYYKQETKGVKTMCKAFEDLIKIMLEERTAEIEEKAAEMLEEKVAKRAAEVLEEKIAKMAEEKAAEIAERAAKRNEELATNMLLKGKYSIEEICEFSTLSKEEVEKLAKKLPVNA